MTAPGALVRLVEPWSQLYSDSTILPILIVFAHVAALAFGGGLAITMDRATLRAARGAVDIRQRQLDELRAAHRVVIASLALSLATGVLLFTADVETYFGSWIYWTKMTLVAGLIANGFAMTRLEHRLRAESSDALWAQLGRTAIVSLILWFTIALAGVALVKAA
jgi:hypothetical protein